MNQKLEKLIAEIAPDMIDDSFLKGDVTDHMVDQIIAIRQLQQLFPSLTYSRRGHSDHKKHDIKLFLSKKFIMTLSCGSNLTLGRIYTDYVSDTDSEKALVMEGNGTDPEPSTLFSKYRKREKWQQKYYKCYNSIATMKEEIIHIIDVAISFGVDQNSFFVYLL